MRRRLGPLIAALVLAALPGWRGSVVPGSAPHARDATALAERGRLLIERQQCGACHRIPGVAQADGARAPTLERFGRRSYIAGSLPNDAATLARWIVAPRALRPDTPMPALGVAEADARAMAAYLLSLT